ncbi:MAG: hypothetical protein ACR2NP_22240, partial [Pirellulaceae bacterium]
RSPRNLAVRTSQTRTRTSLPVYRRVARRALPSDIRSRDEALEALADAQTLNDQARAIAFERLGRVAPRFRDVTQDQAAMLARYMLNATEISELVAIEKSCGQMKHWPNLALALADEIRNSDCAIDQAITCAGLMTGVQFDLGDDENWRLNLYHAMMDRIAEGMQHTAELAGKDNRYQWNELSRYLVELYRLRCLAVGIDGATVSGARSPAELAELLLPGVVGPTDHQTLNRQIRTNHFLADDELHLFALHGQLMAGPASQDAENDSLQAILLRNEIYLLDRLTRAP